MAMERRSFALILTHFVFIMVFSACSSKSGPIHCITSFDCPEGLTCEASACVSPSDKTVTADKDNAVTDETVDDGFAGSDEWSDLLNDGPTDDAGLPADEDVAGDALAAEADEIADEEVTGNVLAVEADELIDEEIMLSDDLPTDDQQMDDPDTAPIDDTAVTDMDAVISDVDTAEADDIVIPDVDTVLPYCGDGNIDAGETCDQGGGNVADGDGCSGLCQIEGDCTCNGTPSVCTCPPVTVTFNYSGSIVTWTVPVTKTYTIEVRGAQGGAGSGDAGGLGARMKGDFALTGGAVLKILVGGQGGAGTNGGGGGGSFVTDSGNSPYIIAGGGGGGYYDVNSAGSGNMAGTTGSTGMDGYNGSAGTIAGLGGAGPNGGGTSAEYPADGSGGGGLTGKGASGDPSTGGSSFTNGGAGGIGADLPGYSLTGGPGGFGGGGGGDFSNWTGGGGGGGYGGGGGGAFYGCGGGGGSYNNGTNQSNAAGVQAGNGLVTITY